MSFHIQFNNVSAYNVSSPLIKKREKGLGFKDVGVGFGRLCTPLSTKILAMPLCFIADGY